jgi:hypothetical protein
MSNSKFKMTDILRVGRTKHHQHQVSGLKHQITHELKVGHRDSIVSIMSTAQKTISRTIWEQDITKALSVLRQQLKIPYHTPTESGISRKHHQR